MNRKEIVLEMRSTGKLIGTRPAVVSVFKNYGLIHNKGGYFVLSIKKDEGLMFQSLSKFLKIYNPKKNFYVDVKDIKSFVLREQSKYLMMLYLYFNDKKFLPLYYPTGGASTYETEVNVQYIVKFLKSKHITDSSKLDFEEETNGEETNE